MNKTLNTDMSNASILTELGSRIKSLRLSKNKDQQQFSYDSGVSLRTLSRLENGHSISLEAVLKVIRTLGLIERLDLLLPTTEISPVQQAKNKHQKQRQRASGQRKAPPTKQSSTANQISEQKSWAGFTQPTTFEPKPKPKPKQRPTSPDGKQK
ncbi:MAG: helix-turn-helix transcriptional regulator [Porticoccus sp.]|nr:helix-turn-helix transcriptional regulator [Porticoccus sp.]